MLLLYSRKMKLSRKDFSKIQVSVPIPNLIDMQKESFRHFLQQDVPPGQRENIGLQAAFVSIFPITDYSETATLEFIDYSLGAPTYDAYECIGRGMTYAIPLRIRMRLVIREKVEKGGPSRIVDIREQEVYLGEMPIMTPNGSFVINGTERVVVSQLQRSPGVSFTHDKGKTHPSGKVLYSARIIPYRGSWLDFEFDAKDVLHVRIDRKRKLPVTTFLKAFAQRDEGERRGYVFMDAHGRVEGASLNEVILRLFYAVEQIDIKDGTFYRVPALSVSEAKGKKRLARTPIPGTRKEGAPKIICTSEELVGKVVIVDLVHPDTGEVLLAAHRPLTEEVLQAVIDAGIPQIEVLCLEASKPDIIFEMLAMENIVSPDEARIQIARRLRPGEAATSALANTFFTRMFFDPKHYSLLPVGRLKINKKLGLAAPMDQLTLTAMDVVATVRYLVGLRVGQGEVEDIDHLGNRRVRSVGELLENQFRIGLARMERSIQERVNLLHFETVLPHDLMNSKPLISAIKEFFAASQLSQFMDQTNPLAELTHKRRLSALGPGGLTRERAGFEVRDVHVSHYGRICPIETPEGPNIGLITSLTTYARVNEYGFIESPYRKVVQGRVTDQIEYLSAIDGERQVIAQANTPLDRKNALIGDTISARAMGEFVTIPSDKAEYMDISPKQIVSVATALIPFLEHDDANRALMGSNMQRQAVPLLSPEAPLVGTGMEAVVARDSGYVVRAVREGIVENVDATRVIVRTESTAKAGTPRSAKTHSDGIEIYAFPKFQKSNQNTCVNYRPAVAVGQRVEAGDILANGPAIADGEIALGRNVVVAFMPWDGYNFEDAIIVSEKMVREDMFTSIHIEEFVVEARDTKLGQEEITRDIPNVGEDMLAKLDESGIVWIGAEIKQGDILVGKVTPKGKTQLTPEEKLLRAIFGEKAGDVKDASLYVPPGIEGVVIDVKIFARKNVESDARTVSIERGNLAHLYRDHQDELAIIATEKYRSIRNVMLDQVVDADIVDPECGEIILKKKKRLAEDILGRLPDESLRHITLSDPAQKERLSRIDAFTKEQIDVVQTRYDARVGRLKRGEDLPPGVLKVVKVYIAVKRKLQVGDKMAGRHGNKGVVSVILPEEDMPMLPDGTPVEMILNPLGVPSRMNVGQILEAHLGWAAYRRGIHVATPIFEGATEADVKAMLEEAGLPTHGQSTLYDSRTGEAFDRPVTVGVMYMMKLNHLVDNKIHARSIGPYSLVTQQPLGGKAQFGGQRLGEMEVWALQAYGAASTLQEFLTTKSDDVPGRSRAYEALVKGDYFLGPGVPESFNVLVKELQGLAIDVELVKEKP